ncbi:Gfo/Idh/MocA family oxidoreductase [Seohaeicola saemankumensis]|nr:Gfo/Idh/MocA family oxidoreductase [Seohaeicola saemankumensis]MCA0870678.1 Gfo/Idh/MocA family oxidoreductase [Seohaeicola saemankumensis]
MSTPIALVGIGKIAQDQHVPAIGASEDWDLAATVSRHGNVPGVENFADLDSMLAARPDIGVVSLCLPPVPRFEYAAAALRAGRHVMLEKPPGATLAECHALQTMAAERGLTLYASWHSRAAGMVAPAKAWLADKSLKKMEIIWKEDIRRWHPGQDWILEAGGMGVFDPGINALSIVTEILPDPIHVAGAILHVPENRQAPIAAQVSFHHPTAQVTADLDFLQTGEQTWTIRAETDQGTMTLTFGGSRMHIDGVEQTGADPDPLNAEYPRLYRHMTGLVASGRSDVDLTPIVHVSDVFTLGRRVAAPPFDF